jgi:hypothetical protein
MQLSQSKNGLELTVLENQQKSSLKNYSNVKK